MVGCPKTPYAQQEVSNIRYTYLKRDKEFVKSGKGIIRMGNDTLTPEIWNSMKDTIIRLLSDQYGMNLTYTVLQPKKPPTEDETA